MTANGLKYVGFLLSLLLTACQTPSISVSIEKPERTAADNTTITDSDLSEISGLATSDYLPSHLWAINDSGNSASIYLIDESLSVKQEVALSISNRDWEDLASFSLKEDSWLIIAETGDNLHRQNSYQLYFYREIDLLNNAGNLLAPEVTINFSYEHGPVNCEAIAVDSSSGLILLFGKSDSGTPVYSLPLSIERGSFHREAQLVANIPPYSDNPAHRLINAITGVNLNSTTSAEITEDQNKLFLLTYKDVWVINRKSDQSWIDALQTKALHFASHELRQAEALAADRHVRRLILTSEGLPAPVLEYHY